MSIQFLYNNLADTSSTLITSTSQETSFPNDHVINTDRNNPWRTPTNGGNFNITAGNSFIDIVESNSNTISAQVSASVYGPGSLAAELTTKINAASGTDTFSVTYTSDFKFKITSDTTASEVLFQTGSNVANGIGDVLGFAATDFSMTTKSNTADNISNHTNEFVQFDLGSAITISTVAIIDTVADGILIQTAANSGTVRWQGSDTENFASLTVDQTLTLQNGQYIQKLTQGSGVIPSARFWRALISDPKNSNGFVQLGYISFGVPFEPTSTDVDPSWELEIQDISAQVTAIGGQKFYDSRDHMRSTSINLPLMSNADHDSLLGVFSLTGIVTPFFLLIDPTLAVSADLSELSIFGRFTNDLNFRYSISDLYSLEFQFDEAL